MFRAYKSKQAVELDLYYNDLVGLTKLVNELSTDYNE
jgi:hypothetical protein